MGQIDGYMDAIDQEIEFDDTYIDPDDRECHRGRQWEEETGCLFPGQCLAAYQSHQKWECYTREHAEEWAKEHASV